MKKTLVSGAAIAVMLATGAVSEAGAAAKRVAPQRVTVVMTEYHFKLSRNVVVAGRPVIFTVLNKGHLLHNFDLEGIKASPIAKPRTKRVLKVTFTKPGRVHYICDVPRHAELGMAGVLRVVRGRANR